MMCGGGQVLQMKEATPMPDSHTHTQTHGGGGEITEGEGKAGGKKPEP